MIHPRRRTAAVLGVVLLALGPFGAACSGDVDESSTTTSGHASSTTSTSAGVPPDSRLGDAAKSGVEEFPVPAAIQRTSKDAGGYGAEREVWTPRGIDASLRDLSRWYATVLPSGADFGSWKWCDESDAASDRLGEEIRRYAAPGRGVVEVELRELSEPFVQLLSYRDGDCTTDPHNVRCVDTACTKLTIQEP